MRYRCIYRVVSVGRVVFAASVDISKQYTCIDYSYYVRSLKAMYIESCCLLVLYGNY